jgi:hypothetical protein
MRLPHCNTVLMTETSIFKVEFLPPDEYAAWKFQEVL